MIFINFIETSYADNVEILSKFYYLIILLLRDRKDLNLELQKMKHGARRTMTQQERKVIQ